MQQARSVPAMGDWADREFVLAKVAKDGWALEHATAELKADREVVLVAVAQNGYALEHAAPELRADREVVLAAIAQDPADPHVLEHAAAALTGAEIEERWQSIPAEKRTDEQWAKIEKAISEHFGWKDYALGTGLPMFDFSCDFLALFTYVQQGRWQWSREMWERKGAGELGGSWFWMGSCSRDFCCRYSVRWTDVSAPTGMSCCPSPEPKDERPRFRFMRPPTHSSCSEVGVPGHPWALCSLRFLILCFM